MDYTTELDSFLYNTDGQLIEDLGRRYLDRSDDDSLERLACSFAEPCDLRGTIDVYEHLTAVYN